MSADPPPTRIPNLPKITPPPAPTFPQRFGGDEAAVEISGPQPAAASSAWPSSMEAVGNEKDKEYHWSTVKTDGERYVEALEDRLKAVDRRNRKDDSGYSSLGKSLEAHSALSPGQSAVSSQDRSLVGDDPQEAEEAEAEAEAQVALLADAGNDDAAQDCEVHVTPATPAKRLERQELSEEQARRISFSESVRISGGLHHHQGTAPKPAASRKISERPRLPSFEGSSRPPPGSITSPSSSVGTSSLVNGSRRTSRSRSPKGRISAAGPSRTPSVSSLRYAGSLAGSANNSYIGSINTTSGFPSGSSSPCSSLYAPLNAPSKACPTTRFNQRVTALTGVQTRGASPSNSTLRALTAYFNGAAGADQDESDEDAPSLYKALVEEQVRARARARRRALARQAVQRQRVLQGSSSTPDVPASSSWWRSFVGLFTDDSYSAEPPEETKYLISRHLSRHRRSERDYGARRSRRSSDSPRSEHVRTESPLSRALLSANDAVDTIDEVSPSEGSDVYYNSKSARRKRRARREGSSSSQHTTSSLARQSSTYSDADDEREPLDERLNDSRIDEDIYDDLYDDDDLEGRSAIVRAWAALSTRASSLFAPCFDACGPSASQNHN